MAKAEHSNSSSPASQENPSNSQDGLSSYLAHLGLRVGKLDDVPRILVMCKAFHNYSGYKFPFEEDYVRHFIIRTIHNKSSIVLVLDFKGTAVGVLAAAAVEHIYSPINVSTELVWWVEPEFRGSKKALELVKAYEYWAVNKMHCKLVTMTSLADGVDKLYEKLGYTKKEHNWCKEFS